MKIGLMGAWNTDSGASIHTELIGRNFIKLGHKIVVFSFFKHSFHGTAIVGEDEDYVNRCFTVSSAEKPQLLATPFLVNDYQFFVVEDLGMLPCDHLGKIFHWIEGDLPAPDTLIKGKIDWDRRYKLMRTHSALHVLCGVVWRDYGAQVTGGNMEPLKGRMDFEFETLQKELVKEIEDKINFEVHLEREIRVKILPREQAFKIPDLIRTKINLLPEHITQVRTVEIVGLDLQADGGTHVANTGEIGTVRIVDYKSKGKINKRIHIELED